MARSKQARWRKFVTLDNCFDLNQVDLGSLTLPNLLELGAGRADFSLNLAAQFPDLQVAAVDVKSDRLQAGARQALAKKLTNLQFWRADAKQLLASLPPASLGQLWLVFPDPHPRTRTAKHRLTHPSFLAEYARILAPKGGLYFKTDSQDLFEYSLESLVSAGWQLEELLFDLHQQTDTPEWWRAMSAYERRFVNEGLRIKFLKANPPR